MLDAFLGGAEAERAAHLGALPGELDRSGAPDSAGGAGDHDHGHAGVSGLVLAARNAMMPGSNVTATLLKNTPKLKGMPNTTRADVAAWLLKTVTTGSFTRQTVVLRAAK